VDDEWNICSDERKEYRFLADGLDGSFAEGNVTYVRQNIVADEDNVMRFGIWKGTCENGQLTTKGMEQHRELGRHLRDIYVDQMKLLPEVYDHQDMQTLHVRTTSVWRTKQSAQSLLEGLYPADKRTHGSYFNLTTYPAEAETMFAVPATCPQAHLLLERIRKEPIFQDYLHHNKKLRRYMDKIFGTKNHPRFQGTIAPYLDVVYTKLCSDFPLPCRHGKCVTEDMAADIIEDAHFEVDYLRHSSPLARDFLATSIGGFLAEIKRDLLHQMSSWQGEQQARASADPTSLQRPASMANLRIYSAHDETVSSVLGAIGADDLRWPPYASNLAFELWEVDGGSLVVRVRYNGQVAASQLLDFSRAPLQAFLDRLDLFIPKDMYTACHPTEDSDLDD